MPTGVSPDKQLRLHVAVASTNTRNEHVAALPIARSPLKNWNLSMRKSGHVLDLQKQEIHH